MKPTAERCRELARCLETNGWLFAKDEDDTVAILLAHARAIEECERIARDNADAVDAAPDCMGIVAGNILSILTGETP